MNNTLLNTHVTKGDVAGAHEVMAMMRDAGVDARGNEAAAENFGV